MPAFPETDNWILQGAALGYRILPRWGELQKNQPTAHDLTSCQQTCRTVLGYPPPKKNGARHLYPVFLLMPNSRHNSAMTHPSSFVRSANRRVSSITLVAFQGMVSILLAPIMPRKALPMSPVCTSHVIPLREILEDNKLKMRLLGDLNPYICIPKNTTYLLFLVFRTLMKIKNSNHG